jgi:hypothetical protein
MGAKQKRGTDSRPLHRQGKAFGCHALHQKPGERYVLTTENSASLGVRREAGPPVGYLQATAGSNDISVLSKCRFGHSLILGKVVIWRMSDQTFEL